MSLDDPIDKAELFEFYAEGPEAGWVDLLREDGLPRLRPIRHRMLATLDLVDAAAPAQVLDVGCGVGIMLAQLLRRYPGATGIGVDLAHPHLVHARDLAARLGVAARARFSRGDLDRLPVRGHHDLIMATEVLEHLLDPAPALSQLRELLAPGGQLIASVPLRFCGDGIIYWQDGEETGDPADVDPDRPFKRFFHRRYTLDKAHEAFRAAGLRVEAERQAAFEFPPNPDLGNRLVRTPWMDRALNWLTGGRYASIALFRLRAG